MVRLLLNALTESLTPTPFKKSDPFPRQSICYALNGSFPKPGLSHSLPIAPTSWVHRGGGGWARNLTGLHLLLARIFFHSFQVRVHVRRRHSVFMRSAKLANAEIRLSIPGLRKDRHAMGPTCS